MRCYKHCIATIFSNKVMSTGHIRLKANKQLQVLINQYDNYFGYLRDVQRDLQSPNSKDYLCFTYLALCSATLEYSLNSLYIDHCINKFGAKEYKPFAETYLSINFPSKLHLAPVTISEGKFKFKTDHTSLKDLEKMITRRNKMLHNKSYLHDLSDLKEHKNGEIYFEVHNHISTLTKEECLTYGVALDKLKKDLLDPYNESRLVETDLVLSIDSK